MGNLPPLKIEIKLKYVIKPKHNLGTVRPMHPLKASIGLDLINLETNDSTFLSIDLESDFQFLWFPWAKFDFSMSSLVVVEYGV